MKKFIPYIKLSKRRRRELDNEQRADWGGVNPVTRTEKNKKRYDRKRSKAEHRTDETE